MYGVSIIVPCFNSGLQLLEAVQSVRAANIKAPHEVIVIDDGSTTVETAMALYELEHNRAGQTPVRVIQGIENKGQAAARNLGIEAAAYEYILPLDSDDKLAASASQYVTFATSQLDRHPDVAFAFSRCRFFGERNGPVLLPPFDRSHILIENMVPVFGIYRREQALDVGGYSEDLRYCEDWDLWLKLLNDTQEQVGLADAAFYNGTPYLYRQHAHNDNVSEKQRFPTEDLLARFARSYPVLYQDAFGSADIEDVLQKRAEMTTPLRSAWLRFSNAPTTLEAASFFWKHASARLQRALG
jgi:glycosyltransferase involved in cell wall biosynthesis